MIDHRRLGFLEASLTDSILDAGRELFINLFVDAWARSAVRRSEAVVRR